ncbi:MAG: SIR2 family protein [Balneola sp.]
MSSKTPKKITQKRLVKIFKDIKRLKSEEIKFCFLLGAGASFSSGIPTGFTLSKKWYDEIKEDLTENELKEWVDKIQFDESRIAEFYPQLYEKRYESFPEVGYKEFERLMDNKEPSLGYVILSQILANEKHNFVITTNFDYMVEDALRMYTSTKPFSAGHETLASFVSLQSDRPTIIKIHRDLFLNPFNDKSTTEILKNEWKEALKPILKNYNLLAIGYGGNDGSLMDYLNELKGTDRKPIYWCKRKNDPINKRVNKLLTEHDYIVEIEDFDELMYALHDSLEYKTFENIDTPSNHIFVQHATKRTEKLNEKLTKILQKINNKDLSKEKADNYESLFKGANDFIFKTQIETDPTKKEQLFVDGIKKYPTNQELLVNYAIFLADIREDFDKAEELYVKALEIDSTQANILNNYAVFLTDVRKNFDKAEEFYTKALEIDSTKAHILGNYANFLADVRKKYDKAEELYIQALDADPENESNFGNYAIFLTDIRKNFDKAEEHYQKALNINSQYINGLISYANFLVSVRKDFEKAEELYNKALEFAPTSHRVLGAYADFLTDIRKDFKKAEDYYVEALNINPNDTRNLCNYAIFLTDIRKDFDKAENIYLKVLDMDPTHTYSLTNYAHVLILSKQNFKKAEKQIQKAFSNTPDQLDLLSELWFYRYAHYPTYLKEAKKELTKLIEDGAKSIGWDLQSHVNLAIKNDHPEPKKLQEFADAIAKQN